MPDTQTAVAAPDRPIAVPDEDSCDFTKPIPVDRRQDLAIEQLRREWHAVARYSLTLSKDGNWNDKTVVAEWLPYDEAIRVRDLFNAALDEARGRSPLWAEPTYSISLHVPPVTKGNTASVGDLLLHERVEPFGEFSLSGTCVFRQFYIAAEVTSVAPGGLILSYRDRDGMHAKTPKRRSFVVSASVIDVHGALATIADQEADRGHWGGEFGGPSDLQRILVRNQRLKAPDLPVLRQHAAGLGLRDIL